MSETNVNDVDESFIDDAFLTSILRRDENDASVVVVNSQVESAVSKGDNYSSVIVRIVVDYTINDGNVKKQRSIIVKSLPRGETMLVFLRETPIFGRELRVYSVTLPAMYKLIEEKTGNRVHFGPKCLQTDRPDTIVLEDLRPQGYKMADRRQGLDYDHSVMAFKTLARFNAASLALHEQDPDSVRHYTEICYTKENRSFHTNFLEPTVRSLACIVEKWPGFERFGDKVRKVADEIINKVIDIMARESSLKVLCHGDFWTNNMLFRYDDNGKIEHLMMVDFQCARYASPATDVIYLLYTSPTQAILEESGDELIEIYLDEFNRTLNSLGCSQRSITKEQLDREISDNLYYSVFCSIIHCIMTADPEDAPKFEELTESNKEDVAVNMLDKAFSGKRFRPIFERRLLKFEDQGLM